jgi:hypothetical protein
VGLLLIIFLVIFMPTTQICFQLQFIRETKHQIGMALSRDSMRFPHIGIVMSLYNNINIAILYLRCIYVTLNNCVNLLHTHTLFVQAMYPLWCKKTVFVPLLIAFAPKTLSPMSAQCVDQRLPGKEQLSTAAREEKLF